VVKGIVFTKFMNPIEEKFSASTAEKIASDGPLSSNDSHTNESNDRKSQTLMTISTAALSGDVPLFRYCRLAAVYFMESMHNDVHVRRQ